MMEIPKMGTDVAATANCSQALIVRKIQTTEKLAAL
jgi:hypothetical protein